MITIKIYNGFIFIDGGLDKFDFNILKEYENYILDKFYPNAYLLKNINWN